MNKPVWIFLVHWFDAETMIKHRVLYYGEHKYIKESFHCFSIYSNLVKGKIFPHILITICLVIWIWFIDAPGSIAEK